jgi:hypothetical protein
MVNSVFILFCPIKIEKNRYGSAIIDPLSPALSRRERGFTD